MRAAVNIKKIIVALLFWGLTGFLFIPLLQDLTQFKTYIDPLNGSFSQAKDAAFDWQVWFSGVYQDQKEKYLKDNFGLRNYYVRLHSQVKYAFFRKANAAYVVVGDEGYLYETGYFNAYYGKDFIGRKRIEEYASKLRRIQDTLARHNKAIVIVLAPGKASFYPEYIPRQYRAQPSLSNYLYLAYALKKNGVNHIDFNRHFIAQKHRSEFPLYPKTGIHWSNYGSILAFDSLVRYTEQKLGSNLPDVNIGTVRLSDSLRHTDNDVIKGMNLLWEPKSEPMAYPEYSISFDSTRHKKPKALVVADSFWWYIYSTNMPDAVFSDLNFWFYNEAVYPASFKSPVNVKETDYFKTIRDTEVIVIMHAEATLSRFGNGFVDMAYQVYCDPDEVKEKIQRMKAVIRADENWYRQVVAKASQRDLPVDSMLTLDAIYVLENQ